MKNKVAVIAFGGNAMKKKNEKGTAEEQYINTQKAAELMVDIIKKGYELIVVHGNGPQVGNILLQMDAAEDVPPFPLDICDAMTEGSMGYMIERALVNEMKKQDIDKQVVTLLTQVFVNPDDPAFQNPTKPIGPFYNFERAEQLKKENNWTMVEDAGRGFRRVVPSPQPLEIVPHKAINALIEKGIAVIAAGGGGIPVTLSSQGTIEGIEAVIDKDFASSLLAREVDADLFIILTGVDCVMENFGKEDAKPLPVIDLKTAREMLADGQFPPGSMGPKIKASIEYIDGGGKEVIITSSGKLGQALAGEAGTRIIKKYPGIQGEKSGYKS